MNQILSRVAMPRSSLAPPWNLNNIGKYSTPDGTLTSRVKSIEDTLTEIIPICKRIGVTRVSDITYLDKLYIPNYSAILPGTDDFIWVYSGKGPTRSHAMASVLMESIERYCSLYRYKLQEPYSRNIFRIREELQQGSSS